MGRTVPTFRQLIEDSAARWSKFRRALRREDQQHFDRLFRRVRFYTQAATYQCSDNPMEAILLSVALDQEKRLHGVEQILQQAGVLDEIRELTTTQAVVTGELTGLDSGPLPRPAGDDPVVDGAEPETPPAD